MNGTHVEWLANVLSLFTFVFSLSVLAFLFPLPKAISPALFHLLSATLTSHTLLTAQPNHMVSNQFLEGELFWGQ